MEGRGKLTGPPGSKNQMEKVVARQQSTGWILISSLPEESALDLENRKGTSFLLYPKPELKVLMTGQSASGSRGHKFQAQLSSRPKGNRTGSTYI